MTHLNTATSTTVVAATAESTTTAAPTTVALLQQQRPNRRRRSSKPTPDQPIRLASLPPIPHLDPLRISEHHPCNVSKGAKVGITDEQHKRLLVHHEAFRAASNRLSDEVHWQWILPVVIDIMEQRADPEDFTFPDDEADRMKDEVRGCFDGPAESVPEHIVDRALDVLLASPYVEDWGDDDDDELDEAPEVIIQRFLDGLRSRQAGRDTEPKRYVP